MHFFKTRNGMWVPCGPKQQGAVQITIQELEAQGLASQVLQLVLIGLIVIITLFLALLIFWSPIYLLDL